jgi:hypothetical protein
MIPNQSDDNLNMRRVILLIIILAFIACSGPASHIEIVPGPLAQKSANKLLTEANKHIGEPYHYGGTNSHGWDCSGFVRAVYNRSLWVCPCRI